MDEGTVADIVDDDMGEEVEGEEDEDEDEDGDECMMDEEGGDDNDEDVYEYDDEENADDTHEEDAEERDDDDEGGGVDYEEDGEGDGGDGVDDDGAVDDDRVGVGGDECDEDADDDDEDEGAGVGAGVGGSGGGGGRTGGAGGGRGGKKDETNQKLHTAYASHSRLFKCSDTKVETPDLIPAETLKNIMSTVLGRKYTPGTASVFRYAIQGRCDLSTATVIPTLSPRFEPSALTDKAVRCAKCNDLVPCVDAAKQFIGENILWCHRVCPLEQ